MFCTYCGKEIADDMLFCPYCGKEVHPAIQKPAAEPKSEPAAEPKPKPVKKVEPVPEPGPETKDAGTADKTSPLQKKPVLIGIIIAATIVFIIILIVIIKVVTGIFGAKKYTVNEPRTVTSATAPIGYGAMSSGALNLSFLYPLSHTAMEQADGIYLYSADGSSQDIILVAAQTGKEEPESYFKKYRNMMKQSYQDPKFDEIREVNTAGKTLYMLRAAVMANGVNQTVDRYVELYNDRYIEYTVMGPGAGSSDALLQGIISSLVPHAGIYQESPNSGSYGDDTRSGGSFGGSSDGGNNDTGDYEDYGDYGEESGDVYNGDDVGLYYSKE